VSALVTAKKVTLCRVGWGCHVLQENVPSSLTYIWDFNYSRVTISRSEGSFLLLIHIMFKTSVA